MNFPMLTLLSEHPYLLILVPLGLLALGGAALLMLLLAPERHRRAVDRLGTGLLANLLVGLVVTLPFLIALVVLQRNGITIGRGFCWLVLIAVAALGVGVFARLLGERVLPEGHVLAQLGVGLLAVLLTALFPPCLPLLLVVGMLGAGAWLRAGR